MITKQGENRGNEELLHTTIYLTCFVIWNYQLYYKISKILAEEYCYKIAGLRLQL